MSILVWGMSMLRMLLFDAFVAVGSCTFAITVCSLILGLTRYLPLLILVCLCPITVFFFLLKKDFLNPLADINRRLISNAHIFQRQNGVEDMTCLCDAIDKFASERSNSFIVDSRHRFVLNYLERKIMTTRAFIRNMQHTFGTSAHHLFGVIDILHTKDRIDTDLLLQLKYVAEDLARVAKKLNCTDAWDIDAIPISSNQAKYCANIKPILDSVIAKATNSMLSKKLRIKSDLSVTRIAIMNEGILEDALLNLLIYAISIACDDSVIKLSVYDTVSGLCIKFLIQSDNLAKINLTATQQLLENSNESLIQCYEHVDINLVIAYSIFNANSCSINIDVDHSYLFITVIIPNAKLRYC